MVALLLSLGAAQAAAAPRVVPISFHVQNVNRSQVLCSPGGGAITVRGHLVLPDGAQPSGVLLALHGLGFGEFFWDFTDVPGYDLADGLARDGHAVAAIDRPGYGASTRPNGNALCIGSQADMAHQMIAALRSGDYTATGESAAPRFSRVALAGHSAGGEIAEVEAASFSDVDALAILGWADQTTSVFVLQTFAAATQDCLLGAAPDGYAPFGRTAADFHQAMFANADPAVVAAVTARRNPDPCGDDLSVLAALAGNQTQTQTIKVPVLLLHGEKDALFPPPADQLQKLRFLGSSDVTAATIAGSGHALTLERSAPEVRTRISQWLARHGF